MVSKS